MAKYYVHTETDSQGDHEVHKEGCSHLPNRENRIYLGEFTNCKDAVKKAMEIYSNSNGCWFCSRDCHRS